MQYKLYINQKNPNPISGHIMATTTIPYSRWRGFSTSIRTRISKSSPLGAITLISIDPYIKYPFETSMIQQLIIYFLWEIGTDG
jgi:hypothetical protein